MKDEEFNKLLKAHEDSPLDLDIINSLAIEYLENEKYRGVANEHFDFFQKAYSIKKTVKTTHNFARFLYYYWAEWEFDHQQKGTIPKALEIQEECLALKPNSHYPYSQYGCMLLDQNQFEKAITYLLISIEKNAHNLTYHNLGYCYYHLGDFNNSKINFNLASKKEKNRDLTLYGLALSHYHLNNTDAVREIGNQLLLDLAPKDGYHPKDGFIAATVFYLIKDFEKVTECVRKGCITQHGFDLLEKDHLAYSVYKADKLLYQEQVNQGIESRKRNIQECKDNNVNWEENLRIKQLLKEIDSRQNFHKQLNTPPIKDFETYLYSNKFECLLFGCENHENLNNDIS